MKNIIVILSILWGGLVLAQQTPASPQSESIAIEGATAHLGNGELIENSLLIFSEGKLTFVGSANARIARPSKVINAQGKHVYPGIIAPAKSLGLIEINAVRASDDEDEIGEIIPHVRSLIAYNAESQVVESMRPNGVLLGQTTPQGGTVSGTSSIVQFDAWNWEDAAVKVDDGIHLHWPNAFKRGRWWMGEDPAYKPNEDYTDEIGKLKTFMENAVAYNNTQPEENNPAFEAMKGVFNGEQKLFIYADREKEIVDAIVTTKDAGVKHVVLIGGYESYKLTGFLKKHNIAVLVRQTHSLPEAEDDDYDLPYKLPKLLTDAGLLVGLQNEDASNFQTRNLPFYAGQVVGQGMEKEKALQLITGNNAEILGIEDQYGTLEVGKSATLFVSEGDALDMRGNQLNHAFIDGRELSLETHQTKLWKRYMGKYNSQK